LPNVVILVPLRPKHGLSAFSQNGETHPVSVRTARILDPLFAGLKVVFDPFVAANQNEADRAADNKLREGFHAALLVRNSAPLRSLTKGPAF
jgi:hypothetical protein